MSGGLAPSKSTIYIGNIPFSLTNNDLHKIFEKYGDIGKVTILKDKTTHKSKGVAFILFLKRDDAHKAVRALNNTQMFGRTLKCSIAKDNGRAKDFIRRKNYPDKSQCYECGEAGHLSYECPKNLLGARDRPEKKKRKRGKGDEHADGDDESSGEDSDDGRPLEPVVKDEESLSAAVATEQKKILDEQIALVNFEPEEPKRKHYKKDTYFSDEESLSE